MAVTYEELRGWRPGMARFGDNHLLPVMVEEPLLALEYSVGWNGNARRIRAIETSL